MRKRIGLAAETASMRRTDDPNSIHRHLEHLGQSSMHVVDDLRRRPQRHLAIDIGRDRAVLLHRKVRVALEEEDVLADVVGAREATIDIAELERDQLVDVVGPAVVLDSLVLRRSQSFLDRHHRLEHLVLDGDGIARRRSDLLICGGHGRNGVSDVSHLFVLERSLVLRHRQDAELDR